MDHNDREQLAQHAAHDGGLLQDLDTLAEQAAQNQSIADIQGQERIYSASLLARYGQRLSMAGAGVGSPLVAPG